MRNKYILLSLAALALSVAACKVPEEKPAIISATPTSISVPAEGGVYGIDVVTTAAWSASSDSWISLTPSSAPASSNLVTVELAVEANTSESAREGAVEFSIAGSSVSVAVVQEGKTPENPDKPDEPDPDDPVEFKGTVSTAAEMKAFLSSAASIADGTEVPIEADIDMSGVEFTAPFEFHGVLNGKNHTIKGLKSSTSLILQNYGTIKDLVLEGEFSVQADGPTFVAALTNINYGTVQNVTNRASVSLSGSDPAGVGVAGIACESYGPIVNCINEGAITLDASGTGIYGAPVAGIVGILGSTVSGCKNRGDVSATADFIAGPTPMGQIAMKYSLTPQVAGVAAYAVKDAGHEVSVSGSDNSGRISLTLSRCENMTVAPGRVGIAGIVAATGGDITSCNNTGTIVVSAISSSRQMLAGSDKNLMIHPAGIAGHEYFAAHPSSQNVTSVRDCNNSGDLVIDCDLSQSNSAAGGIYGWPGVEGVQDKVVEGCVNSGNITVSGSSKIRVGGITGGTGHVLSCKSSGNITVNGSLDSSVFGLLSGFSSQNHRLENCQTEGSVTAKVKVNGLSGLVGCIGNAAAQTGAGCKVNAVLNGTDDTVNTGLVIGLWNGTSKSVIVGTYDNPVKVKGKVNGTDITADNYQDYLYGTGKYTAGVHTVIAAFDDGSSTPVGPDPEPDIEYTYPVLATFNNTPKAELTPGVDYSEVWPNLFVKSDNKSSKLSMNRPEYNGAARSAPKKSTYSEETDGTWAGLRCYVCQGLIKGDYWLFEIPVKNLPAGSVHFQGSGACSTASIKFWLMESSVDGENWTAVEPKTTSTTVAGTAIGREVTYTVEYPQASKEANNVLTPIDVNFDVPAVSGAGTLFIRLTACDLLKGDESGDVTNAEGGGGSRIGGGITITHTAK